VLLTPFLGAADSVASPRTGKPSLEQSPFQPPRSGRTASFVALVGRAAQVTLSE
jgi:hypothetical protein